MYYFLHIECLQGGALGGNNTCSFMKDSKLGFENPALQFSGQKESGQEY